MRATLDRTIRIGLFVPLLTPLIVVPLFVFPFLSSKGLFLALTVEVLVIMSAIWLLKNPASRQLSYGGALGALLGVLAASYLVAGIVGVDWSRSFWSTVERMDGVFMLLHLVVWFLLLVNFFGPAQWRAGIKIIVAVGGLVALHALIEQQGIVPQIAGEIEPRATGLLGNAVFLAGFLLFPLFFGGYLYLSRNETKFWRFFGLAVSILSLAGVFASGTRGAFVGLVIAAGVMGASIFFSGTPRIKKRIVAFTIIALISGALALAGLRSIPAVVDHPLLGRIVSISLKDPTAQSRILAAKMGIKAWTSRPILGYGPENYAYVYATHFDPSILSFDQEWFDKAHNKFIEVMLSGGLPALLSWLLLFAVTFWLIARRRELTLPQRAVIIGLVSAYFIQNLFAFDTPASYVAIFFLWAWLAPKKPQISFPNAGLLRYSAPALLIILSSWALIFGVYKPARAADLTSRAIFFESRYSPEKVLDFYLSAAASNTFVKRYMLLNAISYLGRSFDLIEPSSKQRLVDDLSEITQDYALAHPNDLRMKMAYGSLLAFRAELDKSFLTASEQVFSQLRQVAPNRPESYYELGLVYREQGQFDKMISTYKKALALNPDVARSHWVLGGGYYFYGKHLKQQGQPAQAREMFLLSEKSFKEAFAKGLERESLDVYVVLRDLYTELKDIDKVIEYLQKIIRERESRLASFADQSRPEFEKVRLAGDYASLAAALAETGRIDEARRAGQRAVELDPSLETEFKAFLETIK